MADRGDITSAAFEPEEAIEIGYEAAAPWLQAHCRAANGDDDRAAPALPMRESLRSLMTGPSA